MLGNKEAADGNNNSPNQSANFVPHRNNSYFDYFLMAITHPRATASYLSNKASGLIPSSVIKDASGAIAVEISGQFLNMR